MLPTADDSFLLTVRFSTSCPPNTVTLPQLSWSYSEHLVSQSQEPSAIPSTSERPVIPLATSEVPGPSISLQVPSSSRQGSQVLLESSNTHRKPIRAPVTFSKSPRLQSPPPPLNVAGISECSTVLRRRRQKGKERQHTPEATSLPPLAHNNEEIISASGSSVISVASHPLRRSQQNKSALSASITRSVKLKISAAAFRTGRKRRIYRKGNFQWFEYEGPERIDAPPQHPMDFSIQVGDIFIYRSTGDATIQVWSWTDNQNWTAVISNKSNRWIDGQLYTLALNTNFAPQWIMVTSQIRMNKDRI